VSDAGTNEPLPGTAPAQDTESGKSVDGQTYTPDAWHSRESAVLQLALTISLDELKESAKAFDSIKTRAVTLFAAVSAAVAFLLGSALANLDRHSFNYALLGAGVIGYICFGLCALLTLLPTMRNLYLDGLAVRDRYFQGRQEVEPPHFYDFDRVQWEVIRSADNRTRENIEKLVQLRKSFIGMLLSAAVSVTFFALFLALADLRTP
jgi:hypothetical protein